MEGQQRCLSHVLVYYLKTHCVETRSQEETRRVHKRPEETRRDQRRQERTRGDQKGPEETRRDQKGPEETREDQKGPEETRSRALECHVFRSLVTPCRYTSSSSRQEIGQPSRVVYPRRQNVTPSFLKNLRALQKRPEETRRDQTRPEETRVRGFMSSGSAGSLRVLLRHRRSG